SCGRRPASTRGPRPRARRWWARSPTSSSPRSPRRRCPTSTPTTSRPPRSRSRARPALWESRWVEAMVTTSKRYTDALRTFDREELHGPAEAIDLVKSTASAKFDETVELAVRLGVDPRKADQMVRGTVSLPSGTGKAVRVAVFAAGAAANQAREAGADIVGADDLVERVQGGFLDFDVAIAAPDQMGQVGKLGRLLGPRGLMP